MKHRRPNPSFDINNLEHWVAEAIDNIAAQVGLELLNVLWWMQWHLRDLVCWFLLTDQVIKEKAFNANSNVRTGNNSSFRCLPINDPVVNQGHREEAIGTLDNVVGDKGNTLVQGELHCVFNNISHCSNEENFEEGADVSN